MAEVRWSPRAARELDDACTYIARDSEAVAARLAQRVVAAASRLATFPRSGRIVREFGRDDIREVIVQSYRIVYRLMENEVQLIAIQHAARLLDIARIEEIE